MEIFTSRQQPVVSLCTFCTLLLAVFNYADAQCSTSTVLLYTTPSQPPVTLTSPGYPSAYPVHSHCRWEISAPSSDYRIQITINDLNLGDCVNDYLNINDGSDSSKIVQLCDTNPESITSRGQSIFLEFYSDNENLDNGFSITYSSFAVNVNCPPSWHQNGTNCYKVKSDVQTWKAAQIYCGYEASNLASISSFEEIEFIKSHIPNTLNYWIGLQYLHSAFLWIDATEVIYEAVNSSFSDTDSGTKCFYLTTQSTDWYESDCDGTVNSYICKKNINGTTEVYMPWEDKTEEEGFEAWKIILIVLAVVGVVILVKVHYDKHYKRVNSNNASKVAPATNQNTQPSTENTPQNQTDSDKDSADIVNPAVTASADPLDERQSQTTTPTTIQNTQPSSTETSSESETDSAKTSGEDVGPAVAASTYVVEERESQTTTPTSKSSTSSLTDRDSFNRNFPKVASSEKSAMNSTLVFEESNWFTSRDKSAAVVFDNGKHDGNNTLQSPSIMGQPITEGSDIIIYDLPAHSEDEEIPSAPPPAYHELYDQTDDETSDHK
ncbi:uncharacterized protein LOC144437824 [Glandiceps talaboti]